MAAPPLTPEAQIALWRATRDRLHARFQTLQALSRRAAQADPPVALSDQAELVELTLACMQLLRTADAGWRFAQDVQEGAVTLQAALDRGEQSLEVAAVFAASTDLIAGLGGLFDRVHRMLGDHTERLERLMERIELGADARWRGGDSPRTVH